MRYSTYRLICLCTLANFINSVDRVIMPITVIAMAQQYRWSIAAQGWILSSFAVGYIASQIIGATAASRFGAGNILTLSVFLWSIATAITPTIAADLHMLVIGRIVLGLAEGLGMPMIYQIYAKSVPLAERSKAFGYLISAGTIGQTFAALVTPHLEWPVMFYVFGIAGLVWVIFWFKFYQRTYDEANRTTPGLGNGSGKSKLLALNDEPDVEAPFVSVQPPGPATASNLRGSYRWMRFLEDWALWAIYIAHFAMNWSNYIIMQWLPYYLSRYLAADEKSLSLTALPYLFNAMAGIGAGHLADNLISERKWPILSVRRLMTSIGLFGVGIMMLLFSAARSLASAILIICLAMSLCAFNAAGHLSNHTDVAPNHAGITFAISNTFATIPGLLCGPLTAELVTQSQGRWLPVFLLAAAVNFVGAIIYSSQSSAKVVLL